MTLEDQLELLLINAKLTPFTREHRFHPTRKWRLDFAWPERKVSIELQGGQWTRGAHLRGKQYQSDCEKLNEAQLLGWIVLWFTTDDVTKYARRTVETVKRALQKEA